MLVALIPPPVYHLGYRRIVVGSLERRDVRDLSRRLGPRLGRRERVELVVVVSVTFLLRRFGRVVEDASAFGPERLVDSEEVKVIVLNKS